MIHGWVVYGVGDLVFNTILLSSPQEVIESVCGPAAETFGYNTDEARTLLKARRKQMRVTLEM